MNKREGRDVKVKKKKKNYMWEEREENNYSIWNRASQNCIFSPNIKDYTFNLCKNAKLLAFIVYWKQ